MKIKYTQESFEDHWGFINWKNKIVLDIGADYGSTAECFIAYGASKVFASEGDEKLYSQLVQYAKGKPNIIPSKKWIQNPNDFIDLFNKFKDSKIDIYKIDCEKAEIYLLDISNDMLRSIKEYAIECHTPDILSKISNKFKSAGFEIKNTKFIGTNLGIPVYVIHTIRK